MLVLAQQLSLMFRVIVNLLEFPLCVIKNDVQGREQAIFDVGDIQMSAGFAVLDQGRQLLKRLVSAVGMHR